MTRLQAATPEEPDTQRASATPTSSGTLDVPATPDGTAPSIAQAVLVDQLEEGFAACDDLDQREGFLAVLEGIATGDPRDTGMVVASLRVDF